MDGSQTAALCTRVGKARLFWEAAVAPKSASRKSYGGTALQEFQNKGVLITGAGRGIGKRLALGFAAAGARVGLLARSKAELDLTKLEIEHNGGTAVHLRADVRDIESLRSAVDRMRAHCGDIQVLICGAAMQGPIGSFLETPNRQWVETIETNLVGVANTCSVVIPDMVRVRRGKVIVISGGGGTKPRPGFSAYAASKAGLIRFVETLSEELRDHNVQINCMSPGGTYTHMTDEILRAGDKAGWKEHEDAMRIRLTGGVSAERQIGLAQFLASERSNHVSGKLIHVEDDWKRLENSNVHPEIFTLRRLLKV